jgi:hypothetical protein
MEQNTIIILKIDVYFWFEIYAYNLLNTLSIIWDKLRETRAKALQK